MKKKSKKKIYRNYSYYKREVEKLLSDSEKKKQHEELKKSYHIKTYSLGQLKQNITKRLQKTGTFSTATLNQELKRYYQREFEIATGQYTSKRRENFVKQYVKVLIANGVPIKEIEQFVGNITDENIDTLAKTLPSIYSWASSDPAELQDLNNEMNREQYEKWQEQAKLISNKELERADVLKSKYYNSYKNALEEEVESLEYRNFVKGHYRDI